MQSQNTISALDLASRSANMELEIEASIARLEALCDTLCASTRDRLTRRVNRIPATLRATPMIMVLAPAAASSSSAPSAAPSSGSSAALALAPAPATQISRAQAPKKPAVAKKAASSASTTRKTRNVPTSAPTTVVPKPAPKARTEFSTSPEPSRHTAIRAAHKRTSDEISGDNKETSASANNKRVRTAATVKAAAKPAPKPKTKFSTSPEPSRHTAMRAVQKRNSDEISGDNKENSPVVKNKRARTAATSKAVTKVATTTGTIRATRAASRQQTAQVLSPKNNNVRQKNTKSSTRPR